MAQKKIKTIKANIPGFSFRKLFFCIIFPPLILWYLVKFIMNQIFGEWMGRKILRSQEYDQNHINNIYNRENGFKTKLAQINSNQSGLTATQLRFKTEDGAMLSALEIKTHKESKNSKKYVIHFPTEDSIYEEDIDILSAHAKESGINVIAFNYRNVFKSKEIYSKNLPYSKDIPYSMDDLISDGIHQVERLLKKGILPENIILKGRSLGAAIATDVAKYYHQQKKMVFLYIHDCPSSLTDVVTGWISAEKDPVPSGHLQSTFGSLLAFFARPFISLMFNGTNWEIDAADAFDQLPATHTQSVAVHSPKTKEKKITEDHSHYYRDPLTPDNSTIPHSAQLRDASPIKLGRRENKYEIMEIQQLFLAYAAKFIDKKNEELDEAAEHLLIVNDMLTNYLKVLSQESKLSYVKNNAEDPHKVSGKKLISRRSDQLSEFSLFHHFVKKKVNYQPKFLKEKKSEYSETRIAYVDRSSGII